MRSEDFVESQRTHLVRSMSGDICYRPANLPIEISYTGALATKLSRADRSLSELAGAGRRMSNPHLLISPYLYQEAVQSTRIEGTQVTLEEMLLRQSDSTESEIGIDQREVLNYIRALEHGISEISRNGILRVNLIKGIHEQLLRGVGDARGRFASPGQFRTVQNFIGSSGDTNISAAIFVPPPPELVVQLLTNWESFANTEHDDVPDLIACALLHAQFETIHPFLDGNGRMGRLLITLFLIMKDRLPSPLLYLSSYVESKKFEYYRLLQKTRTEGNWTDWIEFFLDGVDVTARTALVQIKALSDYELDVVRRLGESGGRANRTAADLMPFLVANPYVSIRTVRESLGISDPTARSVVKTLQDIGVLRPFDERQWGRRFVCAPVLEIIFKGAH